MKSRRERLEQRGAGSYSRRFWIDGKQRRITVKASSAVEARAMIALERAKLIRGDNADGKLTVNELLDRWLEDVGPEVSARTLHGYRVIADRHIRPQLGKLRLKKLTPSHIVRARSSWLTTPTDSKRPLHPRTVHHIVTAFKSALLKGVAWRLVDAHLVIATRPPKVETKRVEVPSADEIAALIAAAPADLRAAIVVDVGTGLRRSELLALTWRDFDLQRCTIAVRRSLERRTERGSLHAYKGTKSGRERTVTLPAFAIEALRRHRLSQAERFLSLGIGRPQADTPIFDRLGGIWDPEHFSQRFYQFVKQAELPKVTFHGLRHAYASHLLAAGVHPKIASEALGHSRIAITMDLYSHAAANLQDEAAAKLESALGASIGTALDRQEAPLPEVM